VTERKDHLNQIQRFINLIKTIHICITINLLLSYYNYYFP